MDIGKRMQYRYKVLSGLYPYAYGVKKYWGILLLLGVVTAGLDFVTPLIYKLFIHDVILQADFSKMQIVIAGYLTIYFIGAAAGYIKNRARYTLVNEMTYCVRLKILRNFWKMPFSEYENSSIGDLKMRIDDDTAQIAEFADTQTVTLFLQYIVAAVSTCMLFWLNLELALFSMAAIPLTFWLDNMLSRYEKQIIDKRRENNQKTSSWLLASVQGWREVKALNLAKHETRRYYQFLHTDMIYNAKWINYWTARVLVIPKLKNEFFMQFGLYFIGGCLIFSGRLQIGELLVFVMYYALLSDAIQNISTADADLQSKMPFTDRLLESLSGWQQEKKEAGKIPDVSGAIVLREVSFTYPDAKGAVLENFSLTIEKGERIGIIGKSGSGKTTLLKLMTGMLKPSKGWVFFSGIDLQDINLSDMYSRIGYIMQENTLFYTTIRENMLFGKEDAAEEELWEACRKACIYEFIAGLPKGLDTVIGERGIKLSGGQRQRIILARMFLRDIDIFIFDEATSALDQHSESVVQDAIRNIPKEKTIIVVTHRESSLKLCDRIISL